MDYLHLYCQSLYKRLLLSGKHEMIDKDINSIISRLYFDIILFIILQINCFCKCIYKISFDKYGEVYFPTCWATHIKLKKNRCMKRGIYMYRKISR